MARNPELDHEFKENKTREKQVPLIYRDHDGINEPYEMMAINQAGGLKLKGWKQKLIMAIVAVLAFVIGFVLLYGVIPWLVQILNPTMQGIPHW